MMKTLKYNSRSFIYAFIITLGLIFLMNIELRSPGIYIVSTFIVYSIILFEMFYIWFVSREKLKQMDLPLVSTYTKTKEFVNHLILPSILFFTLSGFIFFNNNSAVRLPLVIFSFVAFASLFINLKAFYLDKYSLEKQTYFVYDMIEMISYFCGINIILSIGELQSLSVFSIAAFVFIATFALLLLNLYQFDKVFGSSIFIVALFAFISAANIYLLLSIFSINVIASSILQFLIYYLLFGVLRHKLEGTLSAQIFFEYFSVFLLALAFLVGIAS